MGDSLDSKICELLERGLQLYGLGEPRQALEVWKEVVNLDPANVKANEYIRFVGEGLGDTASAVTQSSQAVAATAVPPQAVQTPPVQAPSPVQASAGPSPVRQSATQQAGGGQSIATNPPSQAAAEQPAMLHNVAPGVATRVPADAMDVSWGDLMDPSDAAIGPNEAVAADISNTVADTTPVEGPVDPAPAVGFDAPPVTPPVARAQQAADSADGFESPPATPVAESFESPPITPVVQHIESPPTAPAAESFESPPVTPVTPAAESFESPPVTPVTPAAESFESPPMTPVSEEFESPPVTPVHLADDFDTSQIALGVAGEFPISVETTEPAPLADLNSDAVTQAQPAPLSGVAEPDWGLEIQFEETEDKPPTEFSSVESNSAEAAPVEAAPEAAQSGDQDFDISVDDGEPEVEFEAVETGDKVIVEEFRSKPESNTEDLPKAGCSESASLGVASEESGPVESAPAESGPVESEAVESEAVESAPAESGPVESGPVESGPVESGPVESVPVESGPVESVPVESGPVESGPVESAPVESAPVESASVESASVESASVESASVEFGPVGLADEEDDPWGEGPAATAPVTLQNEGSVDDEFLEPVSGVCTIGYENDAISAAEFAQKKEPSGEFEAAFVSEDSVEDSPRTVAEECDQLMKGARDLFDLGDFSGSLELVEKVVALDENNAEAHEYMERNQETLLKMYESKIGSFGQFPQVRIPPDEIIWLNLHHRAGFLLAQIDGTVTYEDLLSLSAMPKLETCKILVQLLNEGVIASE